MKPPVAKFIHCRHSPTCGGCSLLDLSLEDQFQTKIQLLREKTRAVLLDSVEIYPAFKTAYATRERLDFTALDGNIGLFGEDKLSSSSNFSAFAKQIVDIDLCLQLTPELNAALETFRSLKFPLKKASLRLRKGPFEKPGLWIDAGNLEIKALLDESNFLDRASSLFFIEIGQKGKSAQKINGLWKLLDPIYHEWTSTFVKNLELPLVSAVSSFTQPGRISNRILCAELEKIVQQNQISGDWTELGSGIGNFSVLLSKMNPLAEIHAIENNPSAVESIALNKIKHSCDNLIIDRTDFQRGKAEMKLKKNLFVNPPRSGLQRTAELIAESTEVENIVYLSCYPESFSEDVLKLKDFKVNCISAIDQFSGSNHLEIMALLQKR